MPVFRFLAVHSLVAGLALAGIAPQVIACPRVTGAEASHAGPAEAAEQAVSTCCCGVEPGRCGMAACCGVAVPRREHPPVPGDAKPAPVKASPIEPAQLSPVPAPGTGGLSAGLESGWSAPAALCSTLQTQRVRLQV